MALYTILAEKEFEITKLVTTINTDVDRVSMHGLREELLNRQAEALGFPLEKILLHGAISMTEYSEILGAAARKAVDEGNTHSIFGDIFLEDSKALSPRKKGVPNSVSKDYQVHIVRRKRC